MFKPEELEAIPVYLQEIFRELQLNVMIDIVQRIKANNEIPPTADYEISRLYELGASKRQIKKYIKDSLDLSTQEVNHLYKDVLRKGYVRNESLYKAKGKSKIRFEDNEALQQLINAVKKQTNDEFKNITQSMGFAVKQPDGSLKFTKLADYYQRTLDRASADVLSGVYDYNTVLNRTVKEMTDSGLRTVDYASGYSNRVDVAARRALMTGYNQVVGRIAEDDAEILDTEYFEITRHIGARPTHQPWQGRVYSRDELVSVCGYGTVTGLKGANCYHDMMPFIKGVSERVYTDEELDRMNQEENTPKKYGNREYTTYEALQRQRRLETKMRAQRQEIKLLSEGGASEDDINALKSKYNGTQSEYVNFSKAMNLPQEWDRVTVDGLGNIGSKSLKKKSKVVAKSKNGDIIKKEHFLKNHYSIPFGKIIGEKPISKRLAKEYSDEFDKASAIFGKISTISSVEVKAYENNGIWGSFNDNSGVLVLFGAGGNDGVSVLSKIALEFKKRGEWSTSSYLHSFRHELGHAILRELSMNEHVYFGRMERISQFRDEIFKEIAQHDHKEQSSMKSNLLSIYGLDEVGEIDDFVAESIAEYLKGKPRSTAKKVVNILLGKD